jgi:hypothetical protein
MAAQQIAEHLRQLRVPENIVVNHINQLEHWRQNHPPIIRARINPDPPITRVRLDPEIVRQDEARARVWKRIEKRKR